MTGSAQIGAQKSAEDDGHEVRRLRAVSRLGRGGLDADPRFDRITQLASQALNAAVAVISVVDKDKVFFKSAAGAEVQPFRRGGSLYEETLNCDDILVLEDLSKFGRFDHSPEFESGARYRFYAGTALRDQHGQALGTLSIFADEPRSLDDTGRAMLRTFADMVEDELVPGGDVPDTPLEVQKAAERDALTSFLTAREFSARSENMMMIARKAQGRVDLVTVKIHDLNAFNRRDRLLSGDIVLMEMAQRFNQQLEGLDYQIGRCHANGISAAIADIEDIDGLIQKILLDLGEPILTAYGDIEPTVQIAVVPNAHTFASPRELARTMDHLFSECPIVPGAHAKVFGHLDSGKMARTQTLARRLRVALETSALAVNYQPKVRSLSGEIEGMEALLRWLDDELGAVSPLEVVATAEEFGLGSELDVYILESVCRDLRNWRENGVEPTPVSVNISSDHLQMPEFPMRVQSVLESYDVDPSLIDIEILENVVVNDVGAVIDNMKHLRELGVTFSIDDFGTGYSSLSYLMELPLDTLKIDRAFIQNIIDSPKAAALAQAIITIGHEGGMKVVAEGVEDLAQFLVIRAYRCDLVQGYFFSKPLPSADMFDLISSGGIIRPPDMREAFT